MLFTVRVIAALSALSLFSEAAVAANADQWDQDLNAAKSIFERADCFNSSNSITQTEECVAAAMEKCRADVWDGAGVSSQICFAPQMEYADQELNAVYGQTMKKLADLPWSEEAIDSFRKAQRSWIETRDLSCAFVETTARGNGGWHEQCYSDLTLLRIWAIKGFVKSLYMLE